MENFKLLAEKLEKLAKLAGKASNDFERAAVYSATEQIVQFFKESEEQINGYAFEKLTTAQWHINAAVGYDGDNGHDVNFHVSGGLGCAGIFREELEKQFEL